MTDTDLLRRAFPEGYLAMSGVSTVRGHRTALTPDDPAVPSWFLGTSILAPVAHPLFGQQSYHRRPPPRVQHFRRARDAGDLLPNLDPHRDPATWACALRALAELFWTATDKDAARRGDLRWATPPWTGYDFSCWPVNTNAERPRPGVQQWVLQLHDEGGRQSVGFWLPEAVTDPGAALCHAFILARAGRDGSEGGANAT